MKYQPRAPSSTASSYNMAHSRCREGWGGARARVFERSVHTVRIRAVRIRGFEKLEGFPVPMGTSPLQSRHRLGSNPEFAGMLVYEITLLRLESRAVCNVYRTSAFSCSKRTRLKAPPPPVLSVESRVSCLVRWAYPAREVWPSTTDTATATTITTTTTTTAAATTTIIVMIIIIIIIVIVRPVTLPLRLPLDAGRLLGSAQVIH